MGTNEIRSSNEKFIHELQSFNIHINNDIINYNGYSSFKLYEVYLKSLYERFKAKIESILISNKDKDYRFDYLKRKKMMLRDIEDQLFENKNLLAYLELILSQPELYQENYLDHFTRLDLKIDVDESKSDGLKNLDIVSFINSQSRYCFKALSLIYNYLSCDLSRIEDFLIEDTDEKFAGNKSIRQP